MTTLTPEYLASLRKVAEHMRDHGLVLQDMRAENMLALLDRIEALEKDKADALEDLRSAKATLERVNAGLLRLREVGDW